MDMFTAIASERRGLADVLEDLSPAEWDTPSCCAGWTVEDVAAHLTVVWNYSASDYLKRSIALPRTWFRPRVALGAVNERTKDERKATGRDALVAELRAHAEDRTTPTGFGPEAPLGDIVVHARDICLPLGRTPSSDPSHARPVLDAAISRRFALFSTRKLLRGLAFEAIDIGWTSGEGPAVTGPALPLAHALWGRPASLDELSGPGVDLLRQRLTT